MCCFNHMFCFLMYALCWSNAIRPAIIEFPLVPSQIINQVCSELPTTFDYDPIFSWLGSYRACDSRGGYTRKYSRTQPSHPTVPLTDFRLSKVWQRFSAVRTYLSSYHESSTAREPVSPIPPSNISKHPSPVADINNIAFARCCFQLAIWGVSVSSDVNFEFEPPGITKNEVQTSRRTIRILSPGLITVIWRTCHFY